MQRITISNAVPLNRSEVHLFIEPTSSIVPTIQAISVSPIREIQLIQFEVDHDSPLNFTFRIYFPFVQLDTFNRLTSPLHLNISEVIVFV